MGSAVVAKCSCGLKVAIPIGCGMKDAATTTLFPCLCIACHSIVPVNLQAPAQHCPKCQSRAVISYDDPRLLQSPGNKKLVDWKTQEKLGRELVLTDGNYLCPKCSTMSLQFQESGLRWD